MHTVLYVLIWGFISLYYQLKYVLKFELYLRGTSVAQLIEYQLSNYRLFDSGHDPRVVRSSPAWGSVLGMKPTWDSLSLSLSLSLSPLLSLSPPLPFLLSLSLSLKNKKVNKIK